MGRVEIQNDWRLGSRRQLAKDALGNRGHLCVGAVNAGAGLKKDLHYCLAIHGRRFDVLDIVHGGRERPLIDRREAPFQFLGT